MIDWEFVETDRRYVARNVGAGIALNVVLFEDIEAKSQNPIHLGSLGPREFTFLPTNFVDLLRKEAGDDHLTRKRHVLLAEQIDSEEWIVTENLVELQGRVSHRTRIKRLGSSLLGEIHKKTFNEYVDENWPAIQADLDSMLKALKPSNE